jgi:hypothetical protein
MQSRTRLADLTRGDEPETTSGCFVSTKSEIEGLQAGLQPLLARTIFSGTATQLGWTKTACRACRCPGLLQI